MPGRLFEAAAYASAPHSPVYWQTTGRAGQAAASLTEEHKADVVVVGAGYAGLHCARRLARAGQQVIVLEAESPGWGASGRNGGFCCLGGDLRGLESIARRWGEGDAVHYARTQREAIAFVDEFLFQAGLADSRQGHGELCLAHHPRVALGLAAQADALDRWYGVRAEVLSGEMLAARGMSVAGSYGGLYYPLGFGLQPWDYVQALAAQAQQDGVRVYAHSPVLELRRDRGRWVAVTPQGQVRATRLVIATNGYSSEQLPSWMAGRYLPVQSQIMVTAPLSDAQISAQGFSTDVMCYDSRHLLHYFRLLPDRRFLFGMRGGFRAGDDAADKRRIRRHWRRLFPAWRDVAVEYDWSGLLCFNGHGMPFAAALPGLDNAYGAFGWHGNGVALASYSGHLLGGAILGEKNTLPAVMQLTPQRMPLPAQRRLWLRLGIRLAGLADALGR
ncbi:FAD-binding oxidoreductase [Granulosicoccaceae sp. 1_MG-2023]|nr:FAD-binding oxidoreductase [Granulosicoccaceae sp. 1_MG-2023]